MKVRLALPLLACLTALVAGCSGSSDKPQTLPTLTATPVATSSAPPVPAAAKLKTPQGADAFVRFFYAQANEAFARGGPELIAALSSPECRLCNTYEESIGTARRSKQFLDADTFVVKDTAAAPLQKLGTVVEVFGSTPERRLLDSAGHVIQTIPGSGRFHLSVTVKTTSDGWVVADIRAAS